MGCCGGVVGCCGGGNNEVLAREGIDTYFFLTEKSSIVNCNNEVLAREGIDTRSWVGTEMICYFIVTMRY